MSDSVNRPSHYNAGGVETIEGIKAALGNGFSDYCLGNVMKYVWRCKHKGKLIEDLRKASKYLEWAIEAAESNCPEVPDSSRDKPLAIPEGFRELEPDEMPLATDMHEWMGGWVPRKDDATNTYIWHSRRHIRKIETLKPKPLAIPEGWRELEADEMPRVTDLYENEGVWRNRINDSSIEYARYEVRHIRKIETENPSEIPASSNAKPLAIPEGWRELEIGEALSKKDLYCRNGKWNAYTDFDPAGSDLPKYTKGLHYRHIRKIKNANTLQTPNISLPDPLNCIGNICDLAESTGVTCPVDSCDLDTGCRQAPADHIPNATKMLNSPVIPDSSKWIPKVGDNVRVNRPGRLSDGKIGVIVEGDAGEYTVRISGHNLTSRNLTAKDLELIEAAS